MEPLGTSRALLRAVRRDRAESLDSHDDRLAGEWAEILEHEGRVRFRSADPGEGTPLVLPILVGLLVSVIALSLGRIVLPVLILCAGLPVACWALRNQLIHRDHRILLTVTPEGITYAGRSLPWDTILAVDLWVRRAPRRTFFSRPVDFHSILLWLTPSGQIRSARRTTDGWLELARAVGPDRQIGEWLREEHLRRSPHGPAEAARPPRPQMLSYLPDL